MKCLTVQQPWAWAIFNGKNIENRTQMWNYRGLLAIHAGKQTSAVGQRDRRVRDALAAAAPHWPRPFDLGVILGVVDLVDIHFAGDDCTKTCSTWGDDRHHQGIFDPVRRGGVTHLVLENPRTLTEPIPARGALGLWNLADDVERLIRRDLRGDLR
ncbi:hypothetical protein SEA_TWISTER6_8 [Gordonia phage Twister6]|uniref:Helix-turn-helix DNA binding domain protein n=4 Tax=Wizardvirus TaxID=2169658 RepID=A0A345KR36_9CAUD|nr:hypothetical protein BI083_gp08 [Gordonia phage Twister6]YP_010096613.1 helix-turn-helix DNA binding domain protein [Gordonia phage Danyall]YP_010100810.1 hypothetical protein KNU39_gp08 [Gordonia phage Mutzi]YP_010103612.1 ASC-1 transcription coactivator [Gordonia phage Nubi]AOE44917.1 hypothetical protein SEA_TWISTER6_8 [Gordonia phage Twister6]AXH45488.1 helix-turn-helix DNA binding domain protein [Gordonia phage Danyall]QAX92823.1 hypothetical protein SEA_MUTZI_8 [Gordonia phage Mutzi]